MAFTAKEYTPTNLEPPVGKGKSSGAYDDVVKLNEALSIGGKSAKVGAAKEICVVLVGGFRKTGNYGNNHALVAIDPVDGTEGVLWLRTNLATFKDDHGKEKRFVAGNFDGLCLTTFFKRESKSVDEGYDGDYEDSDGEWAFDPMYYGKPIYLGRKAIPTKGSKRVYQVLEWRWCEDQEFPQLPEYLLAYEERELDRKTEAAEKAASKPKTVTADKPATRQEPTTSKTKKTAAAKPAAKKPAATKAKTPTEPADDPVQCIREKLDAGIDPAVIAFDMQVMYGMEEGDVVKLITDIAEEGESEQDEPDPVIARALELFEAGGTIADVSKTLGNEFTALGRDEKLTVTRAAYTLFKSQAA